MAPAHDSMERVRRLATGVAGAVLAIGAYLYSGFARTLVAPLTNSGLRFSRPCDGRYHCPSGTETILVDVAFAVAGLTVLALTVVASVGLLLRGLAGRPVRPGVWVAAAAGPGLAVALFAALLMYGAWVGGFD
jgi:hypothetical protein